ncbi:MAG TPA: TonB C-terminal domain-containing protein, partial [Caulobacteraceae bacterium]|nr:TonB C-terminal domain-containing protein [Caulobacteraceae bacterium]
MTRPDRAVGRRDLGHLRTLAVSLAAALLAASGGPAMGEPVAEIANYDIPAEPLEQALTALGTQGRLDLLYENDVVAGHRSTMVLGVMSRQAALSTLLQGTGMLFRFTGPAAALVFQPDRLPMPGKTSTADGAAPRMMLGFLKVSPSTQIGGPSRAAYQPYGEAIQAEINRRLKADPRIGSHTFHAELAVRVDKAGVIRSLTVTRSTGDPALDQAIHTALDGVMVAAG